MGCFLISKENNYESPWFKIGSPNLSNIFSNSPKIVVKKNTIIIHQDSMIDRVYHIEKGRVRFFILNSTGEEKTMYVLNKGNIFGDVPSVSKNPFMLNAMAVSDCTLCTLESNKYMDYILNDKELTKSYICNLTSTVEYLTHHIRDITFLDRLKLVSKYIYMLNTNYGITTPVGTKINISFTHQEMADLVGSSRVTVTKIMNCLVKENILEKINGYIYVKDIHKLQIICDMAESDIDKKINSANLAI